MLIETNIIAAIDNDGLIGIADRLPWSCKEDMKFFRETTTNNAVIRGRNTAHSLPDRKPLKNRTNIVITRTRAEDFHPDFHVVRDLEEAEHVAVHSGHERQFIIGGAQLYAAAGEQDFDNLYLSHIPGHWRTTAAQGEQEYYFPFQSYGLPPHLFKTGTPAFSLLEGYTVKRLVDRQACTIYGLQRE